MDGFQVSVLKSTNASTPPVRTEDSRKRRHDLFLACLEGIGMGEGQLAVLYALDRIAQSVPVSPGLVLSEEHSLERLGAMRLLDSLFVTNF